MGNIRLRLNIADFSKIFFLLPKINELLAAATVSLTDMSRLQFCQATIGRLSATIQSCLTFDAAEIQRVSAVAISGIQHRVTKTVCYGIPVLTHTSSPD